MNLTDHPARFPIPFANSADSAHIRDIPTSSQTPTSTDAPASLADGFPPLTFQPEASGGIPPNGKDFNGILKQLSAGLRWLQAGGQGLFNGAFFSAIGGAPKNAVLASASQAGLFFASSTNGNAADPDSGGGNWLPFGATITEFDGNGSWRRVGPDGWTEMGGIYTSLPFSESSFSMTFPFGGFGSECLGFHATIRNTASSVGGDTTIQEVMLSQTVARLYAQNHQTAIQDAAGGMRWRAWGRA